MIEVTNLHTTLYKKDTAGKIRTLEIYTEGADLCQKSGLIDGEKVTHRKTCKAKNVGKSNATTPELQAYHEQMSKVAEKLDEGYFRTQKEAEEGEVILPMLAHEFEKMSDKINWFDNVYAQPKLDGQRCLTIIKNGQIKMMSRAGKEIDTMDHIKKEIEQIITPESFFILDGELYAHGLSFQDNMKLIKKVRPETVNVMYHVYDLVDTEKVYSERLNMVRAVCSALEGVNPNTKIKPVNTLLIGSREMLKTVHSRNLSDGYEGTMIRHGDNGYEVNKRSNSLLKYKDFLDLACEIVDVEPSDARPEQGVVICKHMGQIFRANAKMSHEERKELLTNKKDYIGKTAEIRYFELTDGGLPRFPVFVGIRLDK